MAGRRTCDQEVASSISAAVWRLQASCLHPLTELAFRQLTSARRTVLIVSMYRVFAGTCQGGDDTSQRQRGLLCRLQARLLPGVHSHQVFHGTW